MLEINESLTESIKKVSTKLEEDSKQWYKVVINPSLINYDYRIAWTWNEMEKRNKSNVEKDKLRLAFWIPTRAYGEHIEWTNHYCNNKPLELNEWW